MLVRRQACWRAGAGKNKFLQNAEYDRDLERTIGQVCNTLEKTNHFLLQYHTNEEAGSHRLFIIFICHPTQP